MLWLYYNIINNILYNKGGYQIPSRTSRAPKTMKRPAMLGLKEIPYFANVAATYLSKTYKLPSPPISLIKYPTE